MDEAYWDQRARELIEAFKDVPLRDIPSISDASYKTFHAISDPKNDHLFTLEAALKAFSHVKPLDTEEK